MARMGVDAQPLVGVIMGSQSDWETMQHAAAALERLGVPHETRVVSAHRTPDLLFEYASTAATRGLRVIIAGAGGAVHLPGMVASITSLPVIGVPVTTMAIGGGKTAGLMAVNIIATSYAALRKRVAEFKKNHAAESRERGRKLSASLKTSSR